jgi:type IV pilus assembly protein PilW
MRYAQRGFTLVEIMISIVIGLFLTAGMIQMFVGNRQTYRFNEALARMQENGRYALDRMASDLRMADFWGCAKRESMVNRLNPGGFDPVGLGGADGAGGAPDSIQMSGASGAGLRLASTVATVTADIVLDPPRVGDADCDPAFRVGAICGAGDTALVSDCESADLFQVTGVGDTAGNATLGHQDSATAAPPAGTVGNSTGSLSKLYGRGASVFVVRNVVYGIDTGSDPRSLRIAENGNAPQPIAEGVQDMQIMYGKDTDGNGAADEYVSAAGAGAAWFDDVVTVRVSLLLRSTEGGLTDAPQAVPFNGDTFNAPDRNLYQVMTGTFAIRNRIR